MDRNVTKAGCSEFFAAHCDELLFWCRTALELIENVRQVMCILHDGGLLVQPLNSLTCDAVLEYDGIDCEPYDMSPGEAKGLVIRSEHVPFTKSRTWCTY